MSGNTNYASSISSANIFGKSNASKYNYNNTNVTTQIDSYSYYPEYEEINYSSETTTTSPIETVDYTRTYEVVYTTTSTYTTTNPEYVDPVALSTTTITDTTGVDRYASAITTTETTTTKTIIEEKNSGKNNTLEDAFKDALDMANPFSKNSIWEIEHNDTRLKVFNDNRIKYHETGSTAGMGTIDSIIASVLPAGSDREAAVAKRAYNQTAFNKKGNFFLQHTGEDVKKYTTVYTKEDGKVVTKVANTTDEKVVNAYANKYTYNNAKYESFKKLYSDPQRVQQSTSSIVNNGRFMRDYMQYTGGLSGMKEEVKQNMNGQTFGQLVKEGRNANSIRGDNKYIVGYNTKFANYTVYRKGLWDAKQIDNKEWFGTGAKKFAADKENVERALELAYESGERYVGTYGHAAGYAGYIDIKEGAVEVDAIKLRAEYTNVAKVKDVNIRDGGYAECNVGQAKAQAFGEFGIDHVNAVASASVCVVEVEAGENLALETKIGDANIHLCGASVKGDARALEADANAMATFGVYPDEDGNYHIDAGVSLSANAELCSAGVTESVDILGVGTTATARVKVGAGVLCNVGFQDGEFKFKVGLAVGVGFDVGGSVDFSGAINNIKELNDQLHFLDPIEEIWNEIPHNPYDAGVVIGEFTKHKAIEIKNNIKEDYENAKVFVSTSVKVVISIEHIASDYVQEKAEEVKDKVVEKANDIKDKAIETANDVKDKASEVVDNVKDKAEEAKEKALETAENIKNKAVEAATDIKDKASDFKEKAVDKLEDIKDTAVEAANDIKDKAVDKVNDIKDSASDALDEAVDFFDDLPDADDIKDGAKSAVTDAAYTIVGWLS